MALYIGVESFYGTTQDAYSVDSRLLFGQRLRALRTARGISQEKLCQMIKANRNFVGSVERGKQNICLDNIVRLAKALKVAPRELFEMYK